MQRNGAPYPVPVRLWRGLPERNSPWRIVAIGFYRWGKLGPWEKLLAELHRQADAAGEVEQEVYAVNGTRVRAGQNAAGPRKGKVSGC